MDEQPDLTLIQRIQKSGCEDSLRQLIARHTGICISIARQFFPAQSGIVSVDFSGEKDGIIYEAALDFDPKKGVKFCTLLGNRVRWYCLNKLNKNARYVGCEADTLEFLVNQGQLNHEPNFLEEAGYVFSILDQLKDKRISQIFRLRYFSGKKLRSWSSICKEMKMSHQGVINIHNRAIAFLKDKMASKNNSDFV